MQSGSFEREVALWLDSLRVWIFSHEKFTWINLLLSVSPSPIAAVFSLVLAILQLTLCLKGRIPTAERSLLTVALICSLINCILAGFGIVYLAQKGWSFWHVINPFWWLEWWRQGIVVGKPQDVSL